MEVITDSSSFSIMNLKYPAIFIPCNALNTTQQICGKKMTTIQCN